MSHLLRTALKASLRRGITLPLNIETALEDERARQSRLTGWTHRSRSWDHPREHARNKPRCDMEPKMLSTSSKKTTLPERL